MSPHGASVWDKEPSCSTCLTQNKIQLWRVRNPVSQLLAHGGRAHNLGWCLWTVSQRCEGRQTPTRSSTKAARILCAQWFHGELANKICLETANDQSINQSRHRQKCPGRDSNPRPLDCTCIMRPTQLPTVLPGRCCHAGWQVSISVNTRSTHRHRRIRHCHSHRCCHRHHHCCQ